MSLRTLLKSVLPEPVRRFVRGAREAARRARLFRARARTMAAYLAPVARSGWRWLRTSRELTNFTYALDPLNRLYLASAVAAVTRRSDAEILGYFEEIERDDELRSHIADVTAASPHRVVADTVRIELGRRLGWYAVVRAHRPRLVVETGVDKGLGSCVLCSALLRNRAEGFPGEYIGTDRNPAAGYLLTGRYAATGRLMIGDSIESLETIRGIDVFINDSDHSAEYEAREYATIDGRLSPGALVLGDNAHVTRELYDFAQRTGREFLFFRETPANHWYPGGGIGFAYDGTRPSG